MLPRKRPPVHPGEVLEEEFLKPLQLTQQDFVRHLGGSWSQPKLSAILNKKRPITQVIALDFADALGTTPEFWLDLQMQYDLYFAQQKRRKIPRLAFRKRRRRLHVPT